MPTKNPNGIPRTSELQRATEKTFRSRTHIIALITKVESFVAWFAFQTKERVSIACCKLPIIHGKTKCPITPTARPIRKKMTPQKQKPHQIGVSADTVSFASVSRFDCIKTSGCWSAGQVVASSEYFAPHHVHFFIKLIDLVFGCRAGTQRCAGETVGPTVSDRLIPSRAQLGPPSYSCLLRATRCHLFSSLWLSRDPR